MVDELERLRFDSLWLSERATAPSPEPMVGLAFAAGRTTKLKFGTSVQVLPGRNPVLLAKAWATLDRLSGGRALPAFGLGVADPNEQQAFMVDRSERAAWFDEALPLIRRLWTEESSTTSASASSSRACACCPSRCSSRLTYGSAAPRRPSCVASAGWATAGCPASPTRTRPRPVASWSRRRRPRLGARSIAEHFGALDHLHARARGARAAGPHRRGPPARPRSNRGDSRGPRRAARAAGALHRAGLLEARGCASRRAGGQRARPVVVRRARRAGRRGARAPEERERSTTRNARDPERVPRAAPRR